MQAKREKSLSSFTIEPDNHVIFPFFLENFSRQYVIRKQQSFLSLKRSEKINFDRFFRHKTWPFLPLKLKENKSPVPDSKNIQIENKPMFFSQNSFNFTSFLGNKSVKNSEHKDKNTEENGFNISFERNRTPDLDIENENEINNVQQHSLMNDIIQDFPNLVDEIIPSTANNNQIFTTNEIRPNDNHNLIENNPEVNNNNNSADFEIMYRYSLKLFIYKTLKTHFFCHLFMFSVILKFLFDLNSFLVFLMAWISDFFNFLYYGQKVCLSKRLYK